MLFHSWLNSLKHGASFRKPVSRRAGYSRSAGRRRIEALEDRALLAVQTIMPSDTAISVNPGDPASFDMNFQADGQTGGLTLRMHFDSSQLGFTNVEDVFAPSNIGVTDAQLDVGDQDNDPATDMVVIASWFDFTQMWPPSSTQQPFSLLTANFDTSNLSGSSTVNFSADPGGVGNTAEPIPSVTITETIPETPTVSISDAAAVTEGDAAVFTVSLSSSPATDVTVSYSTADGTATAGSDYTASGAQTLTFLAGTNQLTQQVSVPTTDDMSDEPGAAETLFVNLTSATGATIGDSQGQGTINDNDPTPPEISIDDVSVNETDGIATLTLSLSSTWSQTVTVNYATANGTATASSDYTQRSGTATFLAGETTTTVDVPITDTPLTTEPSEAFFVNLSSAVNATIADPQGSVTIVDVPLPELSIDDVTVNEDEGTATFTISLPEATSRNVSVGYSTANNGSADAGEDYTIVSGTAEITAGATSTTVTVPIINSPGVVEPTETFLVNLSGAVNATIDDGQAVGTIIDLDEVEQELGSIHGRKYNDLNADGVRQANEPWLNGWTIQLRDETGVVIDEQVTMDTDLNNDGTIDPATESGWYWFTDVSAGTYTLTEIVQPGWRQTAPSSSLAELAFQLDSQFNFVATGNNFEDWGGRDEKWFFGDGGWYFILPTGELFRWDGSPRTNLTGTSVGQLDSSYHADTSLIIEAQQPDDSATVVLAAGQIVTGINFGNFNEAQSGSIHGRKFEDRNGNGQLDPGELPLNGWTVQLVDQNGNVVDEQVTTDHDVNNDGTIDPLTERGLYWFDDVSAGDYTVREVMQTGWEQTSPFSADAQEAFDLDQAEELENTGNLFEDWGGLNERWLLGSNGWFYVTPDGKVFKWNGSPRNNLSGELVAELSPEYYDDIELLHDAQEPMDHQITVEPGQRVENVNFGNRQVLDDNGPTFPGNGNISYRFDHDDDLILTGDSGDNGILIYLNQSGWITLMGLGETTIGGQSEVVLEGLTSLPDDLKINLRGGNDAVILQNITVGDDFEIDLGQGDNILLGENVLIEDRLDFKSGAGNDLIGMRDSKIHGRVHVNTDGGNDHVLVDNLTILGTAVLLTGTGNDVAVTQNSTYEGRVTVLMDGHDDILGLGSGNTFGRSLTARGGTGQDSLLVDNGNSFAEEPDAITFEDDSVDLDDILAEIMQDLADVGLDDLLDF